MTKKPTWLTRSKILAFGLALVAAGLFTPIYQVAEKSFGVEQTKELLAWILAAKEETEAATNVVANPPPVDTSPDNGHGVDVSDAIDFSRVTQGPKNRVDYKRMQAVNILRFADVDDRVHVRFNNDAPSSWWASSTDHMRFVRLHVFWPDGSGFYGGHIDWVRPGQTYKTLNNIPGNYLGKQPPRGSPVYFCLISNDGKWRSNIVRSKRNW